jgi:hypothetical protein
LYGQIDYRTEGINNKICRYKVSFRLVTINPFVKFDCTKDVIAKPVSKIEVSSLNDIRILQGL